MTFVTAVLAPVLITCDLGIAGAYLAIPVHLHRLRAQFVAPRMFQAFILLCGGTHVLAGVNVWRGSCSVHDAVGLVTVAVALATAVVSLYVAARLPRVAKAALAEVEAERARLQAEAEELEGALELMAAKMTEPEPPIADLVRRAVRLASASRMKT